MASEAWGSVGCISKVKPRGVAYASDKGNQGKETIKGDARDLDFRVHVAPWDTACSTDGNTNRK